VSSEELLRQFDVMTEAPNGVQNLRDLILQLAVRGKLVPQDPTEEPASKLLERARKEKLELLRSGEARDRKLPPLKDDDLPYDLPCSWAWARLDDIGRELKQKVPDRAFTYIDVSSIDSARGAVSEAVQVLDAKDAPSRARKLVRPGAVIYSTVRPYLLNIAVIDRPFTPEPVVSTAFAVLDPLASVEARYLFYYLRSASFVEYVQREMTGMAYPAINDAKFFGGPVPVPPRDEQRRIVAKVNELLALCDRLEARQERRVEARARLNRSLLHHLITAADDAGLAAHWQRLRENFGLVYDTPEIVADLRRAVLQLAVRGMLVPQEPSDEPVIRLLGRIAAEKERRSKMGRSTRLDRLSPISPISKDESPYVVPTGWEWVRFGEATINRDGERVPVSSEIREGRQGSYPYYGASGVIDCIDEFLFDGTLLLIGEDGANLLLRSTPIAFFAHGRYWVNNHAHVVDGISTDLLRYVAIFINATDLAPYVTGTAQPKLNQAKLNSIALALPPEGEQRRIVAKVDELMALCDRLEEQLTRTRQQAARLAASVVHHLTAA